MAESSQRIDRRLYLCEPGQLYGPPEHARLVDEWVGTVGLSVSEYGTHLKRRTKASLIYRATESLRTVQILLGHTNIGNIVRYLGVNSDSAITLAERTERTEI